MPIPDSGTPAAIGFAKRSGIPYEEGLIKNRYVGRTFIQPDQELRRQGIRLKFNPLDEIAGRRLVIVDDSIVRGNTMRALVADALRRRRGRGARPDLVAARRLAVLLRHRHGRRGRARRRAPLGRGDARARRRDEPPLPLARRDAVGDAASRRSPSAAPASRGATRRASREGPGREAPLRAAARAERRALGRSKTTTSLWIWPPRTTRRISPERAPASADHENGSTTVPSSSMRTASTVIVSVGGWAA